jgi:hypothetical protein
MSIALEIPRLPEKIVFPPKDLLSYEPPMETYLHLQ